MENFLIINKTITKQKKLIRFMKCCLIFVILGIGSCFANETYSQRTFFTLEYKNRTVKEIIKEIEQSSEYIFFYLDNSVNLNRKVSVKVENETVEKILDQIFAGTRNQYYISDRQIIISGSKISEPLIMFPGIQQQGRTITGTVRDASGPVIGANVIVKGTTNGAVTNIDGQFSISNVPSNAVLQVSFIGYISQEIPVGNQTQYNITIVEDVGALEEVVVVGYGTLKRRDVTGSVASVSSEQLKDRPLSQIDQALSGQMAGVQAMAITGEPGADMLIRVRGVGSITAGISPLYVVDGFPVPSIQTLNPSDIESIDVLKDASATAIYGSRGANGVVLITTKRGKDGQAKITFDVYTGWQKDMNRPKFFTAKQQAQYYYDGIRNANMDIGIDVNNLPYTEWHLPKNAGKWGIGDKMPQTPIDVLEGRNTLETDMLDAVLRVAPQSRYSLSASGGNNSLKYNISGEFMDQDGIIIGTDFKRYALNTNLDIRLKPKLSLKVSLRNSMTDVSYQPNSGGSATSSYQVISQATCHMPYYPIFNDDGSYFAVFDVDASTVLYNALAIAKERKTKRNRRESIGNVTLNYILTDGLNLNFMAGARTEDYKQEYFRPQLPVFNNDPPEGSDATTFGLNWITETMLNYDKSIKNHNFKALLGFTSEKTITKDASLQSNRYPNNLVETLSAVSGVITTGTSSISEYSLVSYLGRLNYNYAEKYYLTTSLRADGSSRFGTNNKYGYFPSASIMWRMSEENFMKEIKFLSQLRFKLSYGLTGNNFIGNYDHIATISYIRYVLNNAVAQGYAPARIPNPNLTWEKQRQLNTSVEASFLQNRINISVDYFHSTNTDLLLNVNVPTITGFSTSLENIGEVQNKGWEFVLNTVNTQGKFNWSTDFNISTYRNKVIKLGPEGDPIISGWNITQIGQPIGMFYGLLWDGVFMNQAEVDRGPKYSPGLRDESRPGDIRFKDVSGPNGVPDGIITTDDYTIMGSPYPDFYYGMTNRFSYKNISLILSIVGSQGAEILNRANEIRLLTRSRSRTLSNQANWWKSEAEPGDGRTPRPNDIPNGGIRLPNQRHLDSGSFFRVSNISLSYLFPRVISNKLLLNSLRVYATANNPFLITKNTSFNPEVSNSRGSLEPGVDNNNYPTPKSFILGINVEF